MRRSSGSVVRLLKAAALSSAAVGALNSSVCTWGDIGQNVVSGTLDFVEGYTTDWWQAVFPPPEAIGGN